jgi:hypothetical protein
MINYFGFGANATSAMMEAIIGQAPEGIKGMLYEYQLVVQSIHDVPDRVLPTAPVRASARSILQSAWGDDFLSYAIKKAPVFQEPSGLLPNQSATLSLSGS